MQHGVEITCARCVIDTSKFLLCASPPLPLMVLKNLGIHAICNSRQHKNCTGGDLNNRKDTSCRRYPLRERLSCGCEQHTSCNYRSSCSCSLRLSAPGYRPPEVADLILKLVDKNDFCVGSGSNQTQRLHTHSSVRFADNFTSRGIPFVAGDSRGDVPPSIPRRNPLSSADGLSE